MLLSTSRSIRRKLAAVVLATTFVALLLAAVAMVVYDQRASRQAWVTDMTTQADILGRASAAALTFDDAKAANENLSLLRARPTVALAAIYNARGKPFAVYRRSDATQRTLAALPENDGFRIDGTGIELYRRIVDDGEILGTVYLAADSELGARLRDYTGILVAVLGISLLLALLMSTWLQSALTKPILEVAGVARRVIEERDFTLRAKRRTDDEVGTLVDAFNGMLAEVGRRAEALEQANRALEHEAAVRERRDEELRELNADLEHRVAARTRELEDANKELEGFSYSVSHDLRAPLRAVIGFAEALVEDHASSLPDDAKRLVGIVRDEANRMGVLIDELLAFSRLGRQAVQVATLDMSKLARKAYEDACSQYDGVDFQLGALPPAKGDKVLLGQVWVNLISNALKYSSKKERPRIEVSAITDHKEHVYFVRDNGAGFDPRYQAKLFGVFQRLHSSAEFSGTGVGLALVQRIVARHGGRVWAEGKPNEGATFYFAIPKE